MRGTRLILLDHGVDLLHAVQCLLQDHLRKALVADRRLEVHVLCLPVLAGTLHLSLHLPDCGGGRLDLLREVLDGFLQVGDLHLEGFLGLVGLLHGAVVLVQLGDAPVAVPDLIRLLLLHLRDHLVDLQLDLGELVQLQLGGQQRQLRCVGLGRGLQEHILGTLHALLHGAGGGELHELRVHGLVHGVEGGVVVQYFDGVFDRHNLLQAVLHALVELRLAGRAFGLQIAHELLIECELRLGVVELLEGLGVLLLQLRDLLVELSHQLPASGDLVLLGGFQGGVLLRSLLLLGLRIAEVLVEVLLHLLEHAKDLAAGGRVAAVAGDRQERRSLALHLHQEALQRQHLGRAAAGAAGQLQDLRLQKLLRDGLHLRESGVVLAEHDDGLVACLGGLHEVGRLGVGGLVFLHAQCTRLLQSLLVRVDFVQGGVTLGFHLAHLGRGLAQKGLQLRDLRRADLDRLGLLALVGLAPTVQLLVHGLVVVEVLLQLGLHVLQQAHHLHDRALLVCVRHRGARGHEGADEDAAAHEHRHRSDGLRVTASIARGLS
mmetsp:Transcript_46903/g.150755  ORF Transcript_46903/g.150755 Transcript_46903/m.150755 type:complete len:546 (-) Transcript_46903:7-1644(-)